jgi:hypothetical protein
MFARSSSNACLARGTILRRLAHLVPVLWLAAVVGGLGALQAYKSRPGSTGSAPAAFTAWPSSSDSGSRARLTMFLHPHCPCSRASLRELQEILAREPDKAAVEIVFVKPDGAGRDWTTTSLRDQAEAIPGVRVIDDDGTLARRLGAETSGYVVLYDASGKLLFSGGITPSRGHEGRNAGLDAICALLDGATKASTGVQTPVYGCPLFTPGECADARCSADGAEKVP